MVVSSKNTVYSVLFLILVFISVTCVLLMYGIEFLAMILVVVYVGAIAVLFLFVVMMLNIKSVELVENKVRYLPLGFGIGFLLFLELLYIFINFSIKSNIFDELFNNYWVVSYQDVSNVRVLGSLIYTYNYYNFILAGLVLLVAMVGAISSTLDGQMLYRRQRIFSQVLRDYRTSVVLYK